MMQHFEQAEQDSRHALKHVYVSALHYSGPPDRLLDLALILLAGSELAAPGPKVPELRIQSGLPEDAMGVRHRPFVPIAIGVTTVPEASQTGDLLQGHCFSVR